MRYTEKYQADLLAIRNIVPNFEQLCGKKFLISGAGGLICSALVDALLAWNIDAQVYATGRNVEKLRKRFSFWNGTDNLKIMEWDVSIPLESDQCFDFFIHGAAYANPEAYGMMPVETMLSNFLGTEHLLGFVRKQGYGRVMYISSSEVYGTKNDNTAYGEEDYGVVDLLDPRSCYPSSKRAAETLCASYHKEYGVDAVIVRPGHIYGPTAAPEDNRASSQFPRDVLLGKNIVMKSAGAQLRSYCYVLDCVSAMLTVLLKGVSGIAYNISNKNSVVTIRQMAEAFAKAAGQRLVFQDPTHGEAAAFNKMAHSDLEASALESLGWKGMFDLEAGVKATLDAMN